MYYIYVLYIYEDYEGYSNLLQSSTFWMFFFVRCHRPFPRPLRKPQRTLVLGGSQGCAAVWMWGLPSPSVPRTELMVHRFLELPLLMGLFWKWNWGPSWNLCKDLTCNKTVLLTVKATFFVFFSFFSELRSGSAFEAHATSAWTSIPWGRTLGWQRWCKQFKQIGFTRFT